MNDKEAALAACDGAHKDQFTKAAAAFVQDFALAEGNPNADALRKAAGERFKAGLRVYKAAHDAACALVAEVFPASAGAGS